MNYLDIYKSDTCNGIGFRVVLWVSGCSHFCYNCHNPHTWDYNNGKEFSSDTLKQLFEYLDKDYIDGITFSGGDPLNINNYECVYNIIKEIRNKYPNKSIWLYTGYSYEEIIEKPNLFNVVKHIDVLVDGKYIDTKRDISLAFRGSSNQRIINVQESIKQGKLIIYDL